MDVAYNGQLVAFSTNTYNALGQRVRDVAPLDGGTTDEAYDPGGNLLWRYTGASNTWSYVPFNGRTMAEEYTYSGGSGMLFPHPDGLGSITASTSYNGGACQERLFYPFGQLATGAGSCGLQQIFPKPPDFDPGDENNPPNRHYSPSGRWLSPDPLGGDVSNPQSLN